jgi:hypothetical protein
MPTPEEKRLITHAQSHRLEQLRMLTGPMGSTLVQAMADVDDLDLLFDSELGQSLNKIHHIIVESLAAAPCLGVPTDVSTLVDGAHSTYPKTRVDPASMLVPDGWAHFATPIRDTLTGHPVHALSWTTARTTTFYPSADPGHTLLLLVYTHAHNAFEDRPPNKMLRELPELLPMSSVMWELGATDGGLREYSAGQMPKARAHYVRMAATLWSVIRQRIVLADEAGPVLGKRMQRTHKAVRRYLNGSRVNDQTMIARLTPPRRQRRQTSNRGIGTPHSYRYGVRSHWRTPVESKEPILIRAQVRGPEDQEIRPDTVGRLVLAPKPPKQKASAKHEA